jgi:hypothetical protein
MNIQLITKTRRQLFSPAFVTLLIGVVAVLVLGGSSVQAQTATTDSTASTSTTSTTPTTTTQPAGTVDSSITIPVKGSVTDPNGTITVTGSVIVNCRRVIDVNNAVTTPLVLLDFDFSGVKGTSGTVKAQTVYITGDNHASEIRPFQASDTVIVSTPYYDSTKDPLSAKTMLANITLNFDASTGKVTSGSISVGNNVATATTVGTVSATPQ